MRVTISCCLSIHKTKPKMKGSVNPSSRILKCKSLKALHLLIAKIYLDMKCVLNREKLTHPIIF